MEAGDTCAERSATREARACRRGPSPKTHVVDHAGLELVARTPTDDVEDRVIARVEPCAGKRERRTPSLDEAEQIAIEVDRPGHVVGQDREVIHGGGGHRTFLPGSSGSYLKPAAGGSGVQRYASTSCWTCRRRASSHPRSVTSRLNVIDSV